MKAAAAVFLTVSIYALLWAFFKGATRNGQGD
jgi:hypothetical protein